MKDTRFQLGDTISMRCYQSNKQKIYYYKIIAIGKTDYEVLDLISKRKSYISINKIDLFANLENEQE